MAVLEVEATLTERYQSTIPAPVRQALHLSKHDKVVYRIADGVVTVSRKDDEGADPALGAFLEFLARDVEHHPERIRAVPASLRDRIRSLTAGVEFNIDEPLDGDDDDE